MVSYDDLSKGINFTIALVVVLLVLILGWVVALYYKDPKLSGFLDPNLSEPRRATTMGGTAGLLMSESGPQVYQNAYELHHEAIKSDTRPYGVTIPGIAVQRGATSTLRAIRDGGESGPQGFNH